MKLTKKQKIGVGLLVVAATAFGVDRFVLSGAAADADVADAAPVAVRRTPGDAGSTRATSQQHQQLMAASQLARRLDQMAAAEGIAPGKAADAFRPPTDWYPKPKPKPAETTAAAAPPPPPDHAATFRAAHKLSAVMSGGAGNGVAVLAGPSGTLTATVGQAIDGFVLKSVRETGVVLSDGQQEVVLELSKPGIGAAASTAP